MFGLLMVLMTIVMFAALTALTINYIPIDALMAFKARTQAQEGMEAIAEGSVRYIKSVTDIDGYTALPAPGTPLNSIIQPTFAFLPKAPHGMSWTVESATYSGLPAVAICLHPIAQVDPVTQRGVVSMVNHFPAAAMFVGSECKALANGAGSSVTYWVVAQHHG